MATPIDNNNKLPDLGGPRNTVRIETGKEILGDSMQDSRPNQPVIVDLRTNEKLFLQTIPKEIDYQPNNTWAVLQSSGRNVPFFHYTGSEDTVQFSITWYTNDESRLDVIKKCKWLESLSKADGYTEGPPEVLFIFGELFKDSRWIVFSAPYKLSMFTRNFGMMPGLAVQEITLKRISKTNPAKKDYRNVHY